MIICVTLKKWGLYIKYILFFFVVKKNNCNFAT